MREILTLAYIKMYLGIINSECHKCYIPFNALKHSNSF